MLATTLTRIFAAVLALDVLGLVVTLAAGNEDLVRALVIGTPSVHGSRFSTVDFSTPEWSVPIPPLSVEVGR